MKSKTADAPGAREDDVAAKPAKGKAKGAARSGAKAKAAKPAKTAAAGREDDRMAQPAPGATLRKKEFSDRVMARSGLSKAATRDGIAATLAVLAESIAAGESMAIAGFGRTRVSRHITRSGADTYVVRFRPATEKAGAKGVEEDDDDV